MPYDYPPTKAWKDPLGPTTLRQHADNLDWLRWLAAKEHIVSSGEHNAWEVPRVTRRISGTTVSPASSDITAVTNPSAGRYVLTLAGGRFTSDVRARVNVLGDGTKPYLATVAVLSATSVEVYTKKLSTALGVAGNVWALANVDFDISLHSAPLAQTAWNSLPVLWSRGDYFDDRATGWNTLVQECAEIQRVLAAAHTAATGVHNVREVAKKSGKVAYDSGVPTYRIVGGDLSSATRTSAGIAAVTHTSYTTPINAFVGPDYSRYSSGSSSAEFIMNAVQTSATVTTVYMFQWDTVNLWWTAADADFFMLIHGD